MGTTFLLSFFWMPWLQHSVYVQLVRLDAASGWGMGGRYREDLTLSSGISLVLGSSG